MDNETYTKPHNMDEFEVQEWLESLDSVLESRGARPAGRLRW
jgi:pyruvate dehydrogenase complex dehydrogenase (E1) component